MLDFRRKLARGYFSPAANVFFGATHIAQTALGAARRIVHERLAKRYIARELFVNGGNLIASAIDAAKETTSGNEVRVMASDYDQNDSSDLILGSAIKCYNSAVQQELYAFFSGNAAWDQTAAGQSEKVGYTTGAVALAGPHWRFAELSQHDYERLYTQLRNSDLKVDTYADMNTLPDTPNVTVEKQN